MTNSSIDTLTRYEQLISISRDLASTLNIETLINRIVQSAAELSNASESSILLYDSRLGNLYFQASTNPGASTFSNLAIPAKNCIEGLIVINRKAIIIDDAQNDKRFIASAIKSTDNNINTLLGVPLIIKNKVVGVLEVINKNNGYFTQEDQENLLTLGAQAAVAIDNSRLFQQSDLIAEFIHELRTPLASLRTAIHLLDHSQISAEKRKNIISSMQSEINRLAELSTAFLDIARIESGRDIFHDQVFNLRNVLDECVLLFGEQVQQQNMTFEVNLPQELPHLRGDRDKIKQAVINLLSNAIKYNQPEGKITLLAKNRPEEVQIIIEDTGVGIAKKHLKHLFTKFYRVPGTEQLAQGTGLGLSIVEGIIENHQGRVEVESEPGSGTRFIIHLPISKSNKR
ncbi:MAG: GAF domain-containing sensor histidine kinase [Chloroflexi bacterium]|nr:GAF domain-containing sensor histidine kinase [Chloroflexota bacterium]